MKQTNVIGVFPSMGSAKQVTTPSARSFRHEAFAAGERGSSLYRHLRTVLPVPVFAVVWALWGRVPGFTQMHDLMQLNFSVRHIFILAAIITLWSVLVNLRVPSRGTSIPRLEARRILQASIWCSVAVFAITIRTLNWDRSILDSGLAFVTLLSTSAILLASTYAIRHIMAHLPGRKQLVLIIGSGARAQRAVQDFLRYPQYTVLGCVDDDPVSHNLGDLYLGGTDELEALLKQHPVEAVVIGLPVKTQYEQIQKVMSIAESVGVEIHHRESVFDTTLAKRSTDPLQSSDYTVLRVVHHDVRAYVKRSIDILAASIGILLAAPVMLVIAAAVRFTSKGPVLFVQQRYGKNRHRFPMYKFRTMVVDAEARQDSLEAQNEAGGPTFKMKKDPRITSVGKFLRRTSLDELPQMFNVLKGDMSLVGPRPLPVRDVSRFEESWPLRRFSVTPGLTCLWQISGRSNITFDQWMKQDLDYIDNWSLKLDCQILLRTIPAVLKGSGAM